MERGFFREGRAELSLWHKLSKDADIAIDIGANNGIYALVSSVNPNLKIHAFEPVPKVYDMLIENIALNKSKNIFPHQMVIGDLNGVATLYVPKEGWVDVASLNKEFAGQYTEGRELVKHECVSVTLDEFLIQQSIGGNERIICKIDVEGAEPQVLKGAIETIKNRSIVYLIEALNDKYFDEIRPFFPSEYYIYGVDVKSKKLFRTNSSSDRSNNYLFIKTEYPNLLDGVCL